MKKLILLGVVGILLAASITPAFAHGLPQSITQAFSAGLGLTKGAASLAHRPTAVPSAVPTDDTSNVTPVTTPVVTTSTENQNDQAGSSQKPQDGKNFVLFGTVKSETAAGNVYTIVVDVTSGNHLTTTTDGATQSVTITLPADVQLIGQCNAGKSKNSVTNGSASQNKPSVNKGKSGDKGDSGDKGNHGQGKPTTVQDQETSDTSETEVDTEAQDQEATEAPDTSVTTDTQSQQLTCDLSNLTGQFVWVHGWWTPSTTNGTTAGTNVTTDQGTWTARQIKILKSLPTDANTTDQGTSTGD